MIIDRTNLIPDIKYFGAKIGEDFKLIGYVDVKHVDTLVFHANLTQRDLSEVEGKSAEEIQLLAETEANEILYSDLANKVIDDYITLYNLGLYGV